MTDTNFETMIDPYAYYDVPGFLPSDEELEAQRQRAVAFGNDRSENTFRSALGAAREDHWWRPVPVPQVLPGLAKGALGLIVSHPGVDKTMFSLALAMSVAVGRDLFRLGPNLYKRTDARRVIFLGLDDGTEGYKSRVEKLMHRIRPASPLGWQLKENLLVQPIPKDDANPVLLAKTLARVPGFGHSVGLIVLDSLNGFRSEIDLGNGHSLGAAVNTLAMVGQEIGASIIMTHGMREVAMKPNAKQQATASIGATALPDQCSWQLNLVPATGSEVGLVRVHNTKSCATRFRAFKLQMNEGGVTRYVPQLARDASGRFIPNPDRS